MPQPLRRAFTLPELLVVVFVILCSLVSVVQRWGWRAYTKTGIPQRQARKAMRGVMRDSSQGTPTVENRNDQEASGVLISRTLFA